MLPGQPEHGGGKLPSDVLVLLDDDHREAEALLKRFDGTPVSGRGERFSRAGNAAVTVGPRIATAQRWGTSRRAEVMAAGRLQPRMRP
jgi:hypothetical protein